MEESMKIPNQKELSQYTAEQVRDELYGRLETIGAWVFIAPLDEIQKAIFITASPDSQGTHDTLFKAFPLRLAKEAARAADKSYRLTVVMKRLSWFMAAITLAALGAAVFTLIGPQYIVTLPDDPHAPYQNINAGNAQDKHTSRPPRNNSDDKVVKPE